MLAALAERQHGLVARRQLVDAGMATAMVERRVASGHLVRVHRGVYAVGHARLRREGWWLAAVMAAGRGAVLSHRDAAALHGLLAPGSHRRVEVITPARAASTVHVQVRRTTVLDAADVTRVDGIPVTSVARTLVDLAGTVARERLAKALDEAERSGKLDVVAIEDVLRRTASRHGGGHAAMRAALAQQAARGIQLTRSELEERLVALLDAHDLPRALTNHPVHGLEVDAYWPRHGLVVELDGWAFHSTRRAFQQDRERSNDLMLEGLTVLRFTHGDVVRRPGHVAGRIAWAIARARAT